jgi:hypothetical protein
VQIDIEDAPWRDGAHFGLALTIGPIGGLSGRLANRGLLGLHFCQLLLKRLPIGAWNFGEASISDDVSLTMSARAKGAPPFADDGVRIVGAFYSEITKLWPTVV